MKVLSVVGARPQFIKAAPVSAALRAVHHELLVHTGQHYDEEMSAVFFDELGIPMPDYNLGVGSGTHGWQTAQMLIGLEQVLLDEEPDLVLVYGDTNSTLAGALAATKLRIPVAHVEAGLRSFNWSMPEEVNRVVTDRCSQVLFCPTETARKNLSQEGITAGVHVTGDVMYDAILHFLPMADEGSVLNAYQVMAGEYVLATVHRAENTDTRSSLEAVLACLAEIPWPVLLPLHPRTDAALARFDLALPMNVRAVKPAGYLQMVALEKSARLIVTDSGGIQKEAYVLGVPCVTLREETEWVETVDAGWNKLVGRDPKWMSEILTSNTLPSERPLLYGDGRAAERITEIITKTAA
ncbi:MAG: UDP-N-acetylglucosamine 2-epimerase (non-hydrolyzing) [Chloroflexota bacterium]|nr:MAG: UDP-N-acetylglucosamine 2-epimerase (non-hydrolyzing) [Chloroflexota bacterium]